MGELIDKEKAIDNIKDIAVVASVCLTSDEATGMMTMKGRAIESLTNESPVPAIPIEWIVENFIKDRPADESVDFMMMINKWREE